MHQIQACHGYVPKAHMSECTLLNNVIFEAMHYNYIVRKGSVITTKFQLVVWALQIVDDFAWYDDTFTFSSFSTP